MVPLVGNQHDHGEQPLMRGSRAAWRKFGAIPRVFPVDAAWDPHFLSVVKREGPIARDPQRRHTREQHSLQLLFRSCFFLAHITSARCTKRFPL